MDILDDKYECKIDFSKEENYKNLIESEIKKFEEDPDWLHGNNKVNRIIFGKEAEAYFIHFGEDIIKKYYPDMPIKIIPTKEYFMDYCGFPYYNDIMDHQFGDCQIVYITDTERFIIASIDVKRSSKYKNLKAKGCIYDSNGTTNFFRNNSCSYYVRTNFDMSELDILPANKIKDSKIETSFDKSYWTDDYLSTLGNFIIFSLIEIIWNFCKGKSLIGVPSKKPKIVVYIDPPKNVKPVSFSLSNKVSLKSDEAGHYPNIPKEVLEKAEADLDLGFDTDITLEPLIEKDKILPIKKITFCEIKSNWRNFLFEDKVSNKEYIRSSDYSKIIK